MAVAFHRFSNELRRRPESDERQRHITPDYVLEPVRRLLGGSIGLDPATEPDNPTGAERFYCPPHDGCALRWDAKTVWCNPPYGEIRVRWVDRCIAEAGRGDGVKIVLLIPAHTDTRTFQKAFAGTTCLFLQGRVKFGILRENRRQEAASHGSALFGFGVDLTPLTDLGVIAKPIVRQFVLFR
jgi:DNA N-6-adenine-methyltransferase (Dam)